MEILGYFISILIGIVLGLIGGGGSILTVPVLVYLFEINPENATSYSLFIVGVTAMVGVYRHSLMGNLKLKPAVVFAFPSVFSVLLTRKILLPLIPNQIGGLRDFVISKDVLIMVVFAILMIWASIMMIKNTKKRADVFQIIDYKKLAFFGFLIGFLIGFLGAGGGFLIIPALLFFANLPMKQAVGTSLLIIFINSTIGFAGDVFAGIRLDYGLLFSVSGIAICGMFIGTALSKKIEGERLKPFFGWFVLLMGLCIVFKELFGV